MQTPQWHVFFRRAKFEEEEIRQTVDEIAMFRAGLEALSVRAGVLVKRVCSTNEED